MLIFIVVFYETSLLARVDVVKGGVSRTLSSKAILSKSSSHYIQIEPYDYNLKLMNDLMSGKLDIAILPEEYALMAIWTIEDVQIDNKFGNHKYYLVMGKSFNKIKNIIVRENSLDEYYLNKFLDKKKYSFLYANTTEIQSLIANNFKAKNVIADAAVVNEEEFLKLKDMKLGMKSFEGGAYYSVVYSQNNWILSDEANKKKMNNNKVFYAALKKSDAIKLAEINKFIRKKRVAEKYFTEFYNTVWQDLK